LPASSPAIYDRVNEAWLWVGLAAIFLGVAIMLGVALLRSSRQKTTSVRGRMSIYTLGGRGIRKEAETTSTALGDTQVARSAVEFADRAVRGRDAEQLLERKLDAAGLPLKPGEWALVHVGIAVGSGLLLLLLSGGRFLPAVIGLVLGVVIPWLYLTHKESRRQAAFYSQLPDTLQLLAGSLAAGYSLPQAVDTVVREGQDPMAAEFNRALVEARLGVPIEEALDNIAERMNSEDFHWVVLAIRVQREVGGNLAEVLTTVAATLRERERLRRQVQVLSAEGRLSAVIIALIPIMFALFLVVVRPEYIQQLYTTVIGLVMLGFGALMMLVGIIWLRRVVQVEV
jgi:tight adherence protein B